MGRGWAEEKQIGVELRREGSGERGRERVGIRELGGHSQKKKAYLGGRDWVRRGIESEWEGIWGKD